MTNTDNTLFWGIGLSDIEQRKLEASAPGYTVRNWPVGALPRDEDMDGDSPFLIWVPARIWGCGGWLKRLNRTTMTREMAAQRKRFLLKLFKIYAPVYIGGGARIGAACRDYKARYGTRQWPRGIFPGFSAALGRRAIYHTPGGLSTHGGRGYCLKD